MPMVIRAFRIQRSDLARVGINMCRLILKFIWNSLVRTPAFLRPHRCVVTKASSDDQAPATGSLYLHLNHAILPVVIGICRDVAYRVLVANIMSYLLTNRNGFLD